jgi:glycerol-3-phosphate dehydrogenase subunit B
VPIREDVVVVGGGLAGMTAALAAAREGAEVRLLSHKKSTLRQASGLVDVLGYPPRSAGDVEAEAEPGAAAEAAAEGGAEIDTAVGGGAEPDPGPLAEPFESFGDLPEEHPYAAVGADAVREALDLFDGVTGDLYAGGHTDRNALVPTDGGSVKPTARYPASVAPGLASEPRDTLLVGFAALTDFDAPLAAAHLRDVGLPFAVEGVTVDFPGDFRADAKLTRYASALAENERLDGRRNPGAREALAARVADRLDRADADSDPGRVGFPALLGESAAESERVRSALADEIGRPVFEVPGGPPSLPGMRLESAFRAALDGAGVRMTTGDPVVGYEASDGRVEAVRLDRTGRTVPHHADAVVLATGGLVGKGLDSDREAVREPLFDCHVPHPGDRYEWFRDGAFDDHPFARFGVVTDAALRPRDAAGDPEFENLYAAGAVLGGYDLAAEKSGAGVSLATGLVAGRRAARTREAGA